jgi:ubiquinone biosynthesis protein COQ4
LGALRDPLRADYVAAVGDLSSLHVLKDIRRKMQNDPMGREILKDKPRANEETWNQQALLALPETTFGHQYAKWMTRFTFNPENRSPCKYVPELELSYIMQRYRETHDAIHVLLNYDVTVAEELAVKWYEMI